jgi:murein DD-endopeptidase MepM/ murein hydrolase activator NlpD
MVGADSYTWVGLAKLPTLTGRLSSPFGDPRKTGPHKGVDFSASAGSPVLAVLAGQVLITYRNGELDGYGNLIVLKHADNLYSLYAHLNAIYVSSGQSVYPGEKIGAVGTTAGTRTNLAAQVGAHLHFELLSQWPPDSRTANRLDPTSWFAGMGAVPSVAPATIVKPSGLWLLAVPIMVAAFWRRA